MRHDVVVIALFVAYSLCYPFCRCLIGWRILHVCILHVWRIPSSINDLDACYDPGRTYMVAVPQGPPRITAEAVTVLYVRVRVDGFHEEGAVWCPAMISCPDMVEQLGLFIACMQRGLCVCYLNGAPLRDVPAAVCHGDFLAVYKSDSGRSDAAGHTVLATASARRLAASSVATSECPSGHSALLASDLNSESEHLPE